MTTDSNDSLAHAYLTEARRRLAACRERIRHCLGQLDDAQVWWRPHPALNSIANLVLHLCGNLRQWIVSGVGGAPDVRARPQEFAERGPISRDELLQRLEAVVGDADAVLAQVSARQLLEPRRIQGFDETVQSALFNSLLHLAGHTQEIVCLTRLQLGDAYQFAWTPGTPEQGAALDVPSREVAAATDAVFEEESDILPEPAVPIRESNAKVPAPVEEVPSAGPGPAPTSSAPPLGDYVRDIQQEFREEEDEGKL